MSFVSYRNPTKAEQEKRDIQFKAHRGEAALDVCGHCGQVIIAVHQISNRWYHISENPAWLPKSNMKRYCATVQQRPWKNRKARQEFLAKLPNKKTVATPKRIVENYYKEKAKEVKASLQKIHEELT